MKTLVISVVGAACVSALAFEAKLEGEKVVFVGDGNNDMEAMRHADISIAAGLTHHPARSLYSITDYMVFNQSALCRLLNQLS